ncbi:MAG: ComF family protein [Candidatus Jorgensenbacteria bacterium]|nr:ComF family protein [Candidatus Jorgensenbacteria bacterium]
MKCFKLKIRAVAHSILDILFPPQCAACGVKLASSSATAICETCFSKIPARSGFICPACGRRLPDIQNLCHRDAGFILAAATDYGNAEARELLHALKYNHIRSAAHPIAEILAYYVTELVLHHGLITAGALLVPIPLHPRRERLRGYNQAMLVAQIFASKISPADLPVVTDALARVKHTHSQTECADYAERAKNIAGSFVVKNPDTVFGKTVIIFDDVYTSGATMREAARVLKLAGAKKVVGFVFAKA